MILTPHQFLYLSENLSTIVSCSICLSIVICPESTTSFFLNISASSPGYPHSLVVFFPGPQQASSSQDWGKVFSHMTSQNVMHTMCECSASAPCIPVTCQLQATQINCPVLCIQPLGNMMSGSSLIYVHYRSSFSLSLWPPALLQLYLIYRT